MDNLKEKFVRSVKAFFEFSHIDEEISLFIACQFALESNFGKSKLGLDMYNLSGMKYPGSRFTLASSKTDKGFAVYKSPVHCLCDYLIWCQMMRLNQKSDLEQWKKALMKYCPEPYYIDRISSIFEQFQYLLTSKN